MLLLRDKMAFRICKSFLLAISITSTLGLAACSKTDPEVYLEEPAETIYNTAYDTFLSGDREQAAKLFNEVERQHPYSVWALQAQLMAAYSYYSAEKYNDAILILERFIEQHPGNVNIPYAYYLRAVCYYMQIVDVGRDQRNTQLALEGFQELLGLFPESVYARDAAFKLDLIRDHLAGKEMNIGRFYQNQHLYLAAVNRFRMVIQNYQTTGHVPEALHRLTESYLSLGVVDEAQNAAAVLGYNFPGSPWYEDSYRLLTQNNLKPLRKDSSWLKQLF